MTLVRKPLSKSGKILLILAVVVLIALPIVHFTGVYPLDFLGDWAVEVAMVAASSGWMAGAIGFGCMAIGFGLCYILKDYIIGIEGNNLQVTNQSSNTGSYNPTPTQPTQVGVS
jgi:hypothetical protein